MRPQRIFDPKSYQMKYGEYRALFLVKDHIFQKDHEVGFAIQRIAAHEKAIVIDIKGVCIAPGTSEERAASGVFFGPGSKSNEARRVSEVAPITEQAAEAEAALLALSKVKLWTDEAWDRGDNIEKVCEVVVLRTDSNFLAKNMAKMVWEWEERGYKIAHAAQLKELHRVCLGFERWGVKIQFWQVARDQNRHAEALTQQAL